MDNQGILTAADKSNKSATGVQQELPVMGKRIEVTKVMFIISHQLISILIWRFVQYTGT